MSDKKIIFVALFLSALLIGAGWYYSKQQPGPAAILPSSTPTPAVSVTEAGIMMGDPAAPVTVEEYTNFFCSHCRNFANTSLKQIEENYVKTGKVKLVFYIVPKELSVAALCAQEQNKFLEYHDYFFSHEPTKIEQIQEYAVNAGLDIQKFNECYNSEKYSAKVDKWLTEGEARGVEGTPTFFINGQQIIGAVPYEEISKAIDEALAKTQ